MGQNSTTRREPGSKTNEEQQDNYTINACFLKSVYDSAQFDIVSIDSILSDIKTERYKALIDALPDSVKFNKAYKATKSKLPAWALNGTFSGKVDKLDLLNPTDFSTLDFMHN